MSDLREQIARKTCKNCGEYSFGTRLCELDTNQDEPCQYSFKLADEILALFNKWLEEQDACKPATSKLYGNETITTFNEPLRVEVRK